VLKKTLEEYKFGKTSGRQRMTLCDIAKVREQYRELVASSMVESSWTSDDEDLTCPDLTWGSVNI